MKNNSIGSHFIAVPTQLFILLDYRVKLVLISMLQVSSALANTEGWFYYSIDDLKKLSGLKSDKTIRASIETLYRLNIIQVKARTFTNNIGSRTANYYHLNFEEIQKYNEFSVYECLNIPELHIPMLDYTAGDYQTTYTASTENINEPNLAPTDAPGEVTEEIPTEQVKNAPTAQETVISDVVDLDIPIQEEKETPIEKTHYKLSDDGRIIETRSITQQPTEQENSVVGKCYQLVQRYCEMEIPDAAKSEELCSKAFYYIQKKYREKLISENDYKRLNSVLQEAKYKKNIL